MSLYIYENLENAFFKEHLIVVVSEKRQNSIDLPETYVPSHFPNSVIPPEKV